MTKQEYLTRLNQISEFSDNAVSNLQLLVKEALRDKQLTDLEASEIELAVDEKITLLGEGINNPLNNELIYDYSKISVRLKNWKTLNTKGLSYPKFLRDVILPTFHPLPEGDLQYPLLTIACLINSNSLPPIGEGLLKELPLPILGAIGVAGSGKSELLKRIMSHYPSSRSMLWLGDSTGTSLIRKMHELCSTSIEGVLAPAFIGVDNFYPTGSKSTINRMGTAYTSFLSVLRSQSTTSSCTPSDMQTYYTQVFKGLSSIMPVEKTRVEAGELLRRMIFIFTEKLPSVPSSGKYNWASVKEEYSELWSKSRTENEFFPILGDVLSIGDDETVIPPHYFAPSGILIATGVYMGLFDSIDEACKYLAEYWKFVDSRLSKPTDPVLGVLQYYLSENDGSKLNGLISRIKVRHELGILTTYVNERLGRRGTALQDRISEMMTELGYVQDVTNGKVYFHRP